MDDKALKNRKWKTVFSSEVEESDASTYLKARQKLNKINRISKSALPVVKITDTDHSCVVEETHPRVSTLKRKFERVKEMAKIFSPNQRKRINRSLQKENLSPKKPPPSVTVDHNGNSNEVVDVTLGLDFKNKAFMKLAKSLSNRTDQEAASDLQHGALK